jgi:hypothetical protein
MVDNRGRSRPESHNRVSARRLEKAVLSVDIIYQRGGAGRRTRVFHGPSRAIA